MRWCNRIYNEYKKYVPEFFPGRLYFMKMKRSKVQLLRAQNGSPDSHRDTLLSIKLGQSCYVKVNLSLTVRSYDTPLTVFINNDDFLYLVLRI